MHFQSFAIAFNTRVPIGVDQPHLEDHGGVTLSEISIGTTQYHDLYQFLNSFGRLPGVLAVHYIVEHVPWNYIANDRATFE